MTKKIIATVLALALALLPSISMAETWDTFNDSRPRDGDFPWGGNDDVWHDQLIDKIAVGHNADGTHLGGITASEWLTVTGPVTWLSTTSFKVPETAVFENGRKVNVNQVADVIGVVSSVSTAAGETTVTLSHIVLATDNATPSSLTDPITSVSVGVTTPRSAPVASTGPAFQNLVIENDATNPTYQVDVTADALTLYDGGAYNTLQSVAVTCDITVSGANGLDTGGEASSTWYYIFVINNGTTPACLFSISATAPTMPTGYTSKKRVGAVYNKSTSDFPYFHQSGNFVKVRALDSENSIISGGAAGSYTVLSPNVPATTRLLYKQSNTASSNSSISLSVDGVNESDYYNILFSTNTASHMRWVFLTSANQFYYKKVSGGAVSMQVAGYLDNI